MLRSISNSPGNSRSQSGRSPSASDVPQTRVGGGAIVQLPCTAQAMFATVISLKYALLAT